MKRSPRKLTSPKSPTRTSVARKSVVSTLADYGQLLGEITQRIRAAQVRATLASNAVMLQLYWEVGGLLTARQQQEGWGAAVLPRLAIDLANELPDTKGFSVRNLKLMTQFFREYPDLIAITQRPVAQLAEAAGPLSIGQLPVAQLPDTAGNPAIGPLPVAKLPNRRTPDSIGPQSVAQLKTASDLDSIGQRLVAQLTWAHNVLLMQRVKDLPTRFWYAGQVLEHGWSRDVLGLMIDSRAHERQGKAITNFDRTLPPPQSDLASQLLKDPYLFDFLTLEKPFHERELETGLLRHLQHFLVELGTGFAFVGRQVPMEVGDEDFYIDLLFYHLRLRCFVVIDLKVGRFKAEYAGKMNFYLNAVDDRMKHATDQPSIGLILCEDKNKIVAEYALRGMDKAIGVSAYQLTRALPKKLQSALPSIEQLERELSRAKPSKPTAPAKERKRK